MDSEDLRFHAALSQAASAVEEALDRYLPPPDTVLAEAMRHACLSGGKRLRAFLAIESGRLFHVPTEQALRAAAAVECIHAYSLVHDDLPCMDDDALRRGQPTVHVKWDEATAVLAGDALQAMAYEILLAPQTALDPKIQIKLARGLAQASGALGMVGGQALDMQAESAGATLSLEAITELQALKTGRLIVWAAESGAVLGKTQSEPMRRYAEALGLAFQIADDILDVEGDPERTGKALKKDAAANKATFVSLLGLSGAREKGRDLVSIACDSLEPYGSAADNLRLAARFVLSRDA